MQTLKNIYKTDTTPAKTCRLGVTKENDGIRFTTEIPRGKKGSLLLFQKSDLSLIQRIDFPEKAWYGTIHSIKVCSLDWKNCCYQYEIDGEPVSDPFAASVNQGYYEMDFSRFSWGDSKRPEIPFEDGIMYHLHVRNFTMHEKSGVRHKGTFTGLQEKIPYLKKLGINQLLLMPVYEYSEEPEIPKNPKGHPGQGIDPHNKNYWGYKKGCYMAPKRGYCATDNPIREFKTLVKALHKNGIEVILELFFEPEISGRYQVDAMAHWIAEYQIDGFRIMGNTEIVRHVAGDPFFEGTKIISDYIDNSWISESENGYRHLAEMNDCFLSDIRRILKGDEGLLGQFAYRTRRNPESFGLLNYITGHDGFTLNDLVSYDRKHNEENGEQNRDGSELNYSWNCGFEGETKKRDVIKLRNRQKRNAFLMLILSQGTPVILAGDEFGNSQGGNNNPYCLDNPVSWVDWSGYRRNHKLFEFVQQAIAFRQSHRMLHGKTEYRMNDYLACGYPDLSYHSNKAWYADFEYNCRQIGMLYCGAYAKEDEYLYVMYNLHPEEKVLALPKLPTKAKWHICVDTSSENGFEETMPLLEIKEKTMTVPARTILVLIGKKE